MSKYEVGKINKYDVVYIPEKDIIFCKNTALKFPLVLEAIKGKECRTEIPEKNLTITRDNNIVHLGCLTTTKGNCIEIIKNIKKLRNDTKTR